MIAADTSTWVAYFQGDVGSDVEILDRALAARQVVMPPAVLTELLSDRALPLPVVRLIEEVPLLEIGPGFWRRAAVTRRAVMSRKRKARLGDALIAQSCLDHQLLLITRDRDFRAFAEIVGLGLA
ncbi:MAG: PIN domain-containing protein [Bryobacter sp.]|nr:PIN domain-containing protein [Bryobacter sp.]